MRPPCFGLGIAVAISAAMACMASQKSGGAGTGGAGTGGAGTGGAGTGGAGTGGAGTGDAGTGGAGTGDAGTGGAGTGDAGTGGVGTGGNAATLPILAWPFSYTVTPSGVAIHTNGGDVYASIGPWGSHFLPNSGHAFGDAKSDTAAFFTRTLSELSDVDGNACTAGGSCLISEEVMASKIPMYIAPAAGTITSVEQDSTATSPRYYPTNLQYSVRMQVGDYSLLLGHLGSIAPGLRDKVLAATCARGACVDVATWKEFGTGSARDLAIPVEVGEELATPNVAALPQGKPGYYGGAGQAFWPPWIQIEFFLSIRGETICYFDAMDPAERAAFQTDIDRDMSSPDSARYGMSRVQSRKWQWGAEARACNAHSNFPMDFSSLHTNLGGWWKRPPPGGTAEEVLAFVGIAKDTDAYEPNLYMSAALDSLIIRVKPSNATAPYRINLPGRPAIDIDRLNGELMEETNGALLVHWRDVETMDGTFDFYQRGAFALSATGLMIRWGDPAVTADQAAVPVLAVADTCDSTGIDCYDHNPTGAY